MKFETQLMIMRGAYQALILDQTLTFADTEDFLRKIANAITDNEKQARALVLKIDTDSNFTSGLDDLSDDLNDDSTLIL